MSKLNKSKKTSVIDKSISNDFTSSLKVKENKNSHNKSNSLLNGQDFAFANIKMEPDVKYENFLNNFDDLIKGIKNKSDPKINQVKNNLSLQKPTQSALQFGPVFDSSLITQVSKKEEKIDIQTLTNTEEIEDFYDYTENCLHTIGKMKIPEVKEIEHLQIELPARLLNKKLAVFDLDETLVHCELKNIEKADKIITIKLKNGSKARVSIL
jgi:hypothetical protein